MSQFSGFWHVTGLVIYGCLWLRMVTCGYSPVGGCRWTYPQDLSELTRVGSKGAALAPEATRWRRQWSRWPRPGTPTSSKPFDRGLVLKPMLTWWSPIFKKHPCVCMCICMYICMYIYSICIYIYIHISNNLSSIICIPSDNQTWPGGKSP